MKTKILGLAVLASFAFQGMACDELISSFAVKKGTIITLAVAESTEHVFRSNAGESKRFFMKKMHKAPGIYKVIQVEAAGVDSEDSSKDSSNADQNDKNILNTLTVDGSEMNFKKVENTDGFISFVSLRNGKCAFSYTRDEFAYKLGDIYPLIAGDEANGILGKKYSFSDSLESSEIARTIEISAIVK